MVTAVLWPCMLLNSWIHQAVVLHCMAHHYHHHHHHHHLRYLHSPSDLTARRASNSTSIKCKSFLSSHVIRHIHHVVQALTNAKSMVWELLSRRNATSSSMYNTKPRRRHAEEVFSSIRPHVTPISEPLNPEEFEVDRCLYYDSTWNSMISAEVMNCDTASCYDDEEDDEDEDEGGGRNEIDRLAEKFIASCYEKFRLEKQESYRRYREMLARSM